MRARLKSSPTYANVMATVAVVLALGTGSYAAASVVGSSGVVHACVSKSGRVTVLKSGSNCRKGQPLSFNQQGQDGSRGALGGTGNTGPTGPSGAAGPPGPSDGYTAANGGGNTSATVSVTVPAGDYVAAADCTASQINGTKPGSAEATLTAANDSAHSGLMIASVPIDGATLPGIASHFGRVGLSTHAGFHLPGGGTIVETCGDENISDVTGLSYNALTITAVRVGTLHG